MSSKPIQVTLAVRPPRIRLLIRLLSVLNSRWYSNMGPQHDKLEKLLQKEFDCKHVVLMSNGTLPILACLSSLPKGSKVLTTPYSFVATVSSITLSGHTPIFADIDADDLRINLENLESLILEHQPAAILLTHVYGRAENIRVLEALAKKYQVKLFFDSSHCAKVSFENKSILSFGDCSTISFHATKLISAAEGGALVTNDDGLASYARAWRNFGIVNSAIIQPGINAKMNELSAAFCIETLKIVEKEISRRSKIAKIYENVLAQDKKIRVVHSPNHSYFPVLFNSESQVLEAITRLTARNIYPRRYFHPSLNSLHFLEGLNVENCHTSDSIATRVLCLPIGADVTPKIATQIANTLVGIEND